MLDSRRRSLQGNQMSIFLSLAGILVIMSIVIAILSSARPGWPLWVSNLLIGLAVAMLLFPRT